MIHTHQTAPTQLVEANGTTLPIAALARPAPPPT
jgi:hypothetical protein